jgi:hypothetical protein
MLPPFDIYRIEANGDVVWITTAEDWKSARTAVRDLMSSYPHHYIIHSHRTNNQLIVKNRDGATERLTKPLIFQIAYDELLMASRAELLKAHGFEVMSVVGNEAAKAALTTAQNYSLFIVGHSANLQVRREMAAWLKTRYPKVPILALNPAYQQELKPADYNIILNGPEEWLFIVEATA